jgi:hypothetical protein
MRELSLHVNATCVLPVGKWLVLDFDISVAIFAVVFMRLA